MLSFHDLRAPLEAGVGELTGQPLHARAFGAWILGDRVEELQDAGSAALAPLGAGRRTEHVAALGCAAHATPDELRFATQFREDLAWLRKRRFFAEGRPPQYEVDGLALIGTALGILAVRDERLRQADAAWLRQIIETTLTRAAHDDWNGALIKGALALMRGDRRGVGVPADLRVALAGRGLMEDVPEDLEAAWNIVARLRASEDGPSRSAVHLAVYERVLRDAATVRLSGMGVADVAKLLRGLQGALRRWTWESGPRTANSAVARWEVENEYHVQNFLWAVLAPVFPDLVDEEYLPSVGPKKPRADLGIPSLRLVVEAKFLRRAGQSAYAGIVEEIAADVGLYCTPGSPYNRIIVVIWDDLAHTQEHSRLRSGLVALPEIAEAVIVPRPGHMRRSATQDKTNRRKARNKAAA